MVQSRFLLPADLGNRPNGNRSDIMKLLADLHPGFLRFPGGNGLEGRDLRNRFNWKETIHSIDQRPGRWAPSRYYSNNGLGLLEFLEWCQDMRAKPVLAVFAGYCVGGNGAAKTLVKPGPDLDPFVREALEEVEDVTGDAHSTRWGAERAKDGHPEPFTLHYVEIGNEDWFDRSGSYDGRFAQYFKAFKEKYPELQLIATAHVKSVKPDVLDEHFYMSAERAFSDATHYDKTDRNGPRIFVGEWATREGEPTPNLQAALGDAAWMIGMEHNSDLIIMESYAPLLVNVNPGGMQWESDLIGYDALTSYGSPSYWVQAMFASHTGTEVVAAALAGAGPRVFASATRDEKRRKLFIKVVNGTSEAKHLSIALEGVKSIKPMATLVTLSGKSPGATNTITHPDAIVPREHPIQVAVSHFAHSFDPYSVNVVELSY